MYPRALWAMDFSQVFKAMVYQGEGSSQLNGPRMIREVLAPENWMRLRRKAGPSVPSMVGVGGRRWVRTYGLHWEVSSLQTQLPQTLLPGRGSCTGDLQSRTVWFYDGKWPQELGRVTAHKRIPTCPLNATFRFQHPGTFTPLVRSQACPDDERMGWVLWEQHCVLKEARATFRATRPERERGKAL